MKKRLIWTLLVVSSCTPQPTYSPLPNTEYIPNVYYLDPQTEQWLIQHACEDKKVAGLSELEKINLWRKYVYIENCHLEEKFYNKNCWDNKRIKDDKCDR